MPTPKHDNFCPQCGCAKVSDRDEPSEQTRHTQFECGETVIWEQGEGFRATYLCREVPKLMALYEEIIACSIPVVKDLKLAPNTIRMLDNLSKATLPVQLTNKTQLVLAKRLAKLGMALRPHEDKMDVYVMTAWGRHCLNVLKQERGI